jgi:hypothetical protein
MGYVGRIAARPGESVRFHVSAPAAFTLDVVRLGRRAILDPDATGAQDRDEAEVLASYQHDQSLAGTIGPGSYIHVDGPPLPGGPFTAGLWVRLWRLPVLDEIQWAWSGLISDLDFPHQSRFALLVDHLGRIGSYVGERDAFDHASLHMTGPVLADRLGRWSHIALSSDTDGIRTYLDGHQILRAEAPPLSPPSGTSRVRIGASAERGRADDFLDGDIAAPFIAATAISAKPLRDLVRDRARTRSTNLGLGALHAAWDLDEERGARVADTSGNARHGVIVQGGTWQIGGPAFDRARGAPADDPLSDPDRGHGLRLSSDDLVDCEWPVADEWVVPEGAASGLYAGLVRLAGQPRDQAVVITFAVVRPEPRREGSVALLLSTNTWYAYGRRPRDVAPLAGLGSSFYSTHTSGRPFFHVSTLAPIPRADPFGLASERAAAVGHSHLVRPERYAEAWLERERYAYEVITDHDLHAQPDLLSGFVVLLVCGHSEYWSDEARDGVEAFLSAGGTVLSLSGDSIHWRVSFDAGMTRIESRKEVDGDDPRWLSPDAWGERWHSDDARPGGSYRLLGRPAHQTLGLDPGGMIDDGTPGSFSGLRVILPEHPLFHEPEVVPLSPAGTIGEQSLNGPRASGYEFDVVPEDVGTRTDPLPGLVHLASADSQPNLEWQGLHRDRGADMIDWTRPAGGHVFSLGSIGASGALAVDDGIATVVRNVLARAGVARLEVTR